MRRGIPSHGPVPWCHSIPCGEGPHEEACAGNPQAGFCEGETHHGAGSNRVTLPRPKGGSNREYKADRHTGGVLPTRPQSPYHAIIVDADTDICHDGLSQLLSMVKAERGAMCWIARAN